MAAGESPPRKTPRRCQDAAGAAQGGDAGVGGHVLGDDAGGDVHPTLPAPSPSLPRASPRAPPRPPSRSGFRVGCGGRRQRGDQPRCPGVAGGPQGMCPALPGPPALRGRPVPPLRRAEEVRAQPPRVPRHRVRGGPVTPLGIKRLVARPRGRCVPGDTGRGDSDPPAGFGLGVCAGTRFHARGFVPICGLAPPPCCVPCNPSPTRFRGQIRCDLLCHPAHGDMCSRRGPWVAAGSLG